MSCKNPCTDLKLRVNAAVQRCITEHNTVQRSEEEEEEEKICGDLYEHVKG